MFWFYSNNVLRLSLGKNFFPVFFYVSDAQPSPDRSGYPAAGWRRRRSRRPARSMSGEPETAPNLYPAHQSPFVRPARQRHSAERVL